MKKQSQKASAIGEATKTDIEAWKKAHGDVRKFTQTDEEGNNHLTYFRVPNLEDIDYARNVGGDDGMKIGLAMANNVRLGGSDEVMTDSRLKRGFMTAVLKLAKPIEGEVEKL